MMHRRFLTILFLTCLITSALRGDAFLERTTEMEGLTTLGKTKVRSQVYIHGDLKRAESVTTWSGLLGLAASPQKDYIIVDLAKGVQYRLDLVHKTYTIDSLQTLVNLWEPGISPPGTSEPVSPDSGTGRLFEDSSPLVMVQSKWTLRGPLEYQTLHGFDAQHYVVEWLSVWADTAKQETLQHTFTLDLWNSENPDLAQALKEESDYQKRLLEQMGIEIPEGLGALSGIESLVLLLQTEFPSNVEKDLEEKLQKIQGTPVKLTLTSRTVFLGASEKSKPEEKSEPKLPGSPFGDLLGKIQKKVQGQLQKPAEDTLSKHFEEKLQGPVIQITSEILQAKVEPIDPTWFQIPEGFQEVSTESQK